MNGAPVVADRSLTTNEDTVLPFTLTGTDANDQVLNFVILTSPTRGTITGSSPNFVYTPNLNSFGPDSFTYKANDGLVDSNTATVSIDVLSVNDAPDTWFEIFSLNEDTILNVALNRSVLQNDNDAHAGGQAENNMPLTAVLADPPAHASVFVLNSNGTFTYQPNPNFYGVDSFSYRAVDSLGGASEPETVLIGVRAVNDAPVALAQSVSTLEDVPRAILLASTDADRGNLVNPGPAPHDSDPIYTIVTQPTRGTLTGVAPQLVYTPNANYNGVDSFTFTVSDGLATSASATVSIAVAQDADGDILPDSFEMSFFSSLEYSGTDDPDGDGQDNAFELIAGTNPADANDLLHMEMASVTPTGGVFRLSPVRPGVVYVLERSTDLQAWDSISENTYEVDGPGAMYDTATDVGEKPRCFYRVAIRQY
jgi:hypothetical protein